MLVKVAEMGAEVREFSLGAGASVTDALEAAEIESSGRDIRVNSEAATMTTELQDGDIVTLVNKVEGGSN